MQSFNTDESCKLSGGGEAAVTTAKQQSKRGFLLLLSLLCLISITYISYIFITLNSLIITFHNSSSSFPFIQFIFFL